MTTEQKTKFEQDIDKEIELKTRLYESQTDSFNFFNANISSLTTSRTLSNSHEVHIL